MTQSSKQGDPLREVPVGARHSAIKLPNWLYSGCVELKVDADGSSRYSSRDMMVSHRGCSHRGDKEEWYRGGFSTFRLFCQPAGATKGFLFFLPTIGQHLQEEEIMKTNTKVPKTPFFAAFSVGAVLFSAHAGGGFATGNQANTYYVGLGWTGIISAIAAMLLLTLTMREAMIMYNSRGLKSYKQLFETLYHPFDKIFEVFFYIMVLMAVAAAISGAASALNNYFTINYYIGVAIVGVIVLIVLLSLTAAAWMNLVRAQHPYIPVVEESVCNLAAGEVQTFADSCDGRRLFTNSTRIAVTFRADTPQNGTITLWNITDVTDPYPAMFYEVDGRTARCEFTNLSSAERYFVLCDGLSGGVTLSDGRPTDLWESFLDLLHTLFPR